MMTLCDEWIRLECGDCKYFNVRADLDGVQSTCKRLDHKHLRFAKPIFKSYDCGMRQTTTCADFEPRKDRVWLYKHWDEVRKQIIPYNDKEVIFLNIDGDTDVRYAIRAQEFYDGTFRTGDGINWIYRYYYKQCRSSPTGYRIVKEYNDSTRDTNFKDKAVQG